ncbi:transposable element Tcb2 transposase [Trichonephila clavipes]|nr:transposable element Tcb2 transposase [Trichonephila clavipes]
MTAEWFVHDIRELHVLPLMQRVPEGIFEQDSDRPLTARASQGCLRTVTILPWPALSPDLFPIEHIWDYLERQVAHPTSFIELEASLLQTWNELSPDIMQNMYASMPDRFALEWATGY